MILDLPRFLKAQQPGWQELEKMLQRVEDDPGARWSIADLKRFHYLYQRAGADLAKLQTFASEPDLCRYLESLVSRAYAEVHETQRQRRRLRPLHWFLTLFPAAFQLHIRAFWLSLAITMGGALFGAGVVALDPDSKAAIVPFSHLHGNPSDRVAEEESAKEDPLQGHQSTFSSQLMVNNIRVSILAFALGMTFGIGTMIVLFYNGVILGLVITDYLLAGEGVFLTAWLLPHGSIEIPAILIAGQAGLVLGSALIGRGERISISARMRKLTPTLVTLLGGVAVMLVWAGIVESFISQYHQPFIPYWIKIAFGGVQLFLLIRLLTRRPTQYEPSEITNA